MAGPKKEKKRKPLPKLEGSKKPYKREVSKEKNAFVQKGLKAYDEGRMPGAKEKLTGLAMQNRRMNRTGTGWDDRHYAEQGLGTLYDAGEAAKATIDRVRPVRSKAARSLLKDYKRREKK